MKMAQLFFKRPIINELGLASNEPVPYQDRRENSPFIFYAFPPQAEIIPYISRDLGDKGRIHINTGLWFGGQQMFDHLAVNGFLGMVEEVRPGYENTFKLLAKDFKRVLEEFESPKVPLRRLVETYLNYPDVFYHYVVKRGPPDQKLRDDIYILLVREFWNQQGLSMPERFMQMQSSGSGKSLRDSKHLSTNAGRLRLPPARCIRRHGGSKRALLRDSHEQALRTESE